MTKTMHGGHKASTSEKLGAAPADSMHPDQPGERVLKLVTMKNSSGNITTTASVAIVRDTGRGYATETTAIFSDFFKKVHSVVGKTATVKNVRAVHAEALHSWPAIIEEAKAFYANKAEG